MQSKILILINKTPPYRVCLTFNLITKYHGKVGRIMTLLLPSALKGFCVLISGTCKCVGFMAKEIKVADGMKIANP